MNNLLRVGSIKPFVVAQVGILLRHPLPWVSDYLFHSLPCLVEGVRLSKGRLFSGEEACRRISIA